ncbi:hypothetical protein K1719_039323 [Acacia pycnantha]|nr:hypothetical protein K1719_039323 [Acacia pycnantha]
MPQLKLLLISKILTDQTLQSRSTSIEPWSTLAFSFFNPLSISKPPISASATRLSLSSNLVVALTSH